MFLHRHTILKGQPLGIEKSFSKIMKITRMGIEPRTFGMTPNRQHYMHDMCYIKNIIIIMVYNHDNHDKLITP